MAVAAKKKPRTATHRPALKRRRYRHDELTAVDLFTGFGGFTLSAEIAGFTAIMAANHNAYKIEVHEANHPTVEHWIADLVDREASDYHSARDLPAADLLLAGVSCVNHSQANTVKAYEHGAALFDLEDPDYEARVTRSERDRATANCVLHYAAQHHPRLILVECTTELTSWGPALPNRPKVGDGTTFQWWLKQFGNLKYKHKVMYLNSMFFGVPQSRDRLFIAFWDEALPDPDLEHRPVSHCGSCDRDVEAVWSWKTGIPASGTVRYGKQYNYRCPSCRREVVPPMTPSLAALDLSDLGVRIGDKPVKKQRDGSIGPLAAATLARAERCRQRFPGFPAVLMPAKAVHGTEKHLWQPMATQTSQQETSILSTGPVIQPLWDQAAADPVAIAVDNYQGGPRGVGEPLPTQVGSETLAVVSSGIVPFRKNTVPTVHAEAMPTFTAEQIPGLLTAAGTVNHGGLEAQLAAEWRATLSQMPLEDCYFRMMREYEIGRGCGFDVDFPNYKGKFIVWGSARNQVDGFGNAVSPQVGAWIGARLRAILHSPQDCGTQYDLDVAA